MTAAEFLRVSTRLFEDLKVWVAEAAKDDMLSASDLAMINSCVKIVESVTLREAALKPEQAN